MGYDQIEKAAEKQIVPVSPDCPVCGDPLTQDSVVVCLSCSAPHHEMCWEFNKGCSTYACSCRVYAVPSSTDEDHSDDLVFERKASPQFLVRWHMSMIFLIPLMGLLGAMGLELLIPVFLGTWMSVFLGAFLGAYGVRYTLDPENQLMTRQVKLLGMETPWKEEIPFSRIKALSVVSYMPFFAHMQMQQHGPYGVPHNVQLIMKDEEGEEYLVDCQQNEKTFRMLWQAERAAEALDTVVRMDPEFFALARPRPELLGTLKQLPAEEGDPPKLLDGDL